MPEPHAIISVPDANVLRQVVQWWKANAGRRPQVGGEHNRYTPAVRMRVKSEQNDYITCRTWDGTTEGSSDIKVAKPFKFRGFIGSTGTPTKTIEPPYAVNDQIFAQCGASGGTGVTDVNFWDTNVDGRALVTDCS